MFMAGNYQATTNIVLVKVPVVTMKTWLHEDSTFHAGVLEDDETSALIEKAREVSDPAERVEVWAQIQKKVAELDPFLFLTRPVMSLAVGKDVGGVELFGTGGAELDKIWLQQ